MREALSNLFADSRSLWTSERIQEYRCCADPLSFLREHVGQSVPCVWRGAASHWKAVKKWPEGDFDYLRDLVGKREIEVTVTPNGRADAVLDVLEDSSSSVTKFFARPHQVRQPFEELLDDLTEHAAGNGAESSKDGAELQGISSIPYYSAQDSSLTRELPELLDDVDEDTIRFAKAAFGSEPSAINIWVGDGRSVTTMHADPFENLYAVVTGTKVFDLRPPCDAAFLPKPSLGRVRWVPSGGAVGEENMMSPKHEMNGWGIVREEGKTEWIDEDCIDERWNRSSTVVLNSGDLLYLPALWCT